jgi:hypothetical protein
MSNCRDKLRTCVSKRPESAKTMGSSEFEVIMAMQSKLIRTGQAASNMMGAAFGFVRHTVASLGVWLLPIVVGALTAAAVSGSLSLHRGSRPNADRDKVTVDAEKPLSVVELYYSGDYVKVVKRAHREQFDILADIKSLESAWNTALPATPLTIELVSSAVPESTVGKSPAPGLTVTAVVDETNFDELRPILEDVRNLILDGDGSGYGRLRCSGYQAQPTEPGKTFRPGSRGTDPDLTRISPARLAPGPAETL